ncbi:FtsQ-type POTRA domain-containing protein [Akkermansiaceae bacterium]|nr:FtsQ-type POTRA domain-containing protein [Akkermansiaceae bacterium]
MSRRKTTPLYSNGGRKKYRHSVVVRSPRIFIHQSFRFLKNLCVLSVWGVLFYYAGLGIYNAKKQLIDENEEFALKEINLSTNGSITTDKVLKIAELSHESVLFSIDTEEVKQRLEALPEVITARVVRKLPNTLKIEIDERVPIAWLHAPSLEIYARDAANGVLIGHDGVTYNWVQEWDLSNSNLPVLSLGDDFCKNDTLHNKLSNDEALIALSLISKHDGVTNPDIALETISVENFYTLKATYQNSLEAVFGMSEHDRQLKDLNDICEHAKFIKKELSWVDLRPVKNIPGRYKITQNEIPNQAQH